jgi:hypothetical protein
LVEAAADHLVRLLLLKAQLVHVVLERHVRVLCSIQLSLQGVYCRLEVLLGLGQLLLKLADQQLLPLLSFIFLLHELHLELGDVLLKFKLDVQQCAGILLRVLLYLLN